MKKLSKIICISFMITFSACAQKEEVEPDFAPRVYFSALHEPQNTVLSGAGQDDKALIQYTNAVGFYARPKIYMTYFGLKNNNIDVSINNQFNAISNLYKWAIIPQIGLSMTTDGTPTEHYEDKVANGDYDANIAKLSSVLKAYGKPVFLRLGFEFNGWWNGYRPETYKAAYKRIVDKFRADGVTNVATVWCFKSDPTPVNNDYMAYYPGDNYVDWWGIDLFDPTEFSQDINLQFVADASIHKKPVMIGECTPKNVGVLDGQLSWTNWFEPFFKFVKNTPHIKAFCYINWEWKTRPQWSTWGDARLEKNSTVLLNWVKEMNSPLFEHANIHIDKTK